MAGHFFKTIIFSRPVAPDNGFTLIELVVVIALITMMFFFSIPKLNHSRIFPEREPTIITMIQTIRQLKEKAILEQKRYTLHLDIAQKTIWISHEFMTDDQLEKASKGCRILPENLRLREVEFPLKNEASRYRADIHFYPQGFSDKAVIHFEMSYNEKSVLLVEPFLIKVRLIKANSLRL